MDVSTGGGVVTGGGEGVVGVVTGGGGGVVTGGGVVGVVGGGVDGVGVGSVMTVGVVVGVVTGGAAVVGWLVGRDGDEVSPDGSADPFVLVLLEDMVKVCRFHRGRFLYNGSSMSAIGYVRGHARRLAA